MNGTWINGRQATDAEAAAVRKGYDDAHERDLRALAGRLGAGVAPQQPADRPITDISWDLQLHGNSKGTR